MDINEKINSITKDIVDNKLTEILEKKITTIVEHTVGEVFSGPNSTTIN